MSSYRPLVVYCMCELSCPLYSIARECAAAAAAESKDGLEVAGLAMRVLRVNTSDERYTEVWARVSGDRVMVEYFDKLLRQAKGVYFQQVYSNKFSRVLRILVSKSACHECTSLERQGCPLTSAPLGAMAKTTVVTPRGVLYEFIVARKAAYEELQRSGCKVVLVHAIDEYDYMLTEKQEVALVNAYFAGYYSFPRRISLKNLAARLGLSVSTLAELLRRAEAKVVDSFVRHELPHYIVENVFRRRAAARRHRELELQELELLVEGEAG